MDLAAGLKGRHVLVTGASGGLGDHFARLCASCGAAVTVAARRKEKLDALVRDLLAAGAPEARAVALDVADPDSVTAAFAALHALPDVVVNNAGIAEGGAAIDVDIATFDRVIDTNLRGVWAMSVTAARAWRDAGRGGVIVNVASILGLRVAGGVGPYTVSKAGVVQMTQALGLELGALRHPGQRAGAGLHRHRHQPRVLRDAPRPGDAQAHPDAAAGPPGGPRRRLPAARRRRLGLDDRRDPAGRRRPPRLGALIRSPQFVSRTCAKVLNSFVIASPIAPVLPASM